MASSTVGNDAEVGGERLDLPLPCAQIGRSAAVNENHRRTMPLIDVRQRGVVQPDVLVVVHSRYLTGSLAGMLSASGAALTDAPCGRINATAIGAMVMFQSQKTKNIDRTLCVFGSS